MSSDPVKWAVIENFSIASFGGKHEASFTMFWFFTNYTNFVWLTGTIFQKLHTRQSEIHLVDPQNVHLNLLRCRCKNSKRFSNFRPPQLPRRSSANCLHANLETLERSLKHFSCVTEVARDVFPRQKRTLCMLFWRRSSIFKGPQSDEVLCSPEILSGGFTQSLIILVDIECIDYSWIFDCRVSRFLKNRARESRFL